MKKYLQVSTFAFALALIAAPAFAQVGSSTDHPFDPVRGPKIEGRFDARVDMKQKREEAHEIKSSIMDAKEDRMDMMKENKAEMEAKFEARKAEMEALKVKLDAATTPEEKASIKAEFESARAEFKTDVKSERKENRVEVRAQTAHIKSLRLEAVATIHGAMIERMEKLSDRIGSRIEKLAAEGKDVVEAKAQLAVAVSEIALAKADHAALVASGSIEKGSKEIALSMKTHLKLAHDAFMKAVASLKVVAQ